VKVPAGLALRPGGNRRETKCIELVLPAPLTGQPSQTVARGERAQASGSQTPICTAS